MKIYGNTHILSAVSNMIEKNHIPHAFMLFGDKGLGKKKIAEYISAMILCESNDKKPCMVCKSCKNIFNNSHPDVKKVVHNSEIKGFSVQNLREIITDAYVFPNNSDKKIYILQDCDSMLPSAQNTLLKIIEEPPAHCIFIFTVKSKEMFLPTIISRVCPFGVGEVSVEDCKNALLEKGFADDEKLKDAINAFGGNIGLCNDYFINEDFEKSVFACREISKSIGNLSSNNGEYSLMKSMFLLDGKKEITKLCFNLLISVLRDAQVKKTGSEILKSCCKNEALVLANVLSARKISEIYKIITNAYEKIEGNGNLALTLVSTASQIKSVT